MTGLTLKRFSTDGAGTYGVLLEGTTPLNLILENPWIDNQPNVSCIPAGLYRCKRIESPKYGDTFEVQDVEGRSHILFHWGNTERDTKGCVLVGSTWGRLYEQTAVLASLQAFKQLMARLEGVDEFNLWITWVKEEGI